MCKWLFTYLLLTTTFAFSQEEITISGYLKDSESKEVLLYSKVFVVELKKGVLTNEYGFFSIQVPVAAKYTVQMASSGYPLQTIEIDGTKSIQQDFFMNTVRDVQEVTVTAKKSTGQELIENTEVSVIRLDIKEAKNLPAIGGETDVLKVAQLLPGINRGSEGGTNFFVRGGDGDQNLILVDEATVYNPGHLFGFFSVFNPDVIKEMSIYKGGFPSYYSGRLSSITDIRTIDGDKSKTNVVGGIGMLSSRITIEGPIKKDRISYMVSARRSYIDQVFKLTGQNIPFYFYDFNAKVHTMLNRNNKLFLASYYGNDVLKFSGNSADSTQGLGFGFKLGNFTQTARWTHLFSDKLFANLTFVHTQFKYDIFGAFLENNLLIKSAVRDLGLKYDLQYFMKPGMKIQYGINLTNHRFRPNVVSTAGEISEYLKSKQGALISTVETNTYIDVNKTLSEKVKIDYGLSLPMSFVTDKVYTGFSPRANLAIQLKKDRAIKFSISRMYQFMHRVSSSSIALPTDLWYPISKNIKPQIADQFAISFNKNLPKRKSYIVIETYYKYMQNLTEYREGSQIILNDHFEDLLIQGKGWSGGFEFLYKKDEGKLTGWIGYTLSWTKRRFDELNGGAPFWAKYDRRNYLTVAGTWVLRRRLSFAVVFEAATGARFTPIIGQYFLPNAGLTGFDLVPVYAEKNSYKMSASRRVDINFILKSKNKKQHRFTGEWHLGAYNFFNRATPYQIKVVQTEEGNYKYTQPGLLGFTPSIGYNFKF
ncbi:MAG: TonB-dependent receptor [Bacteroidota bacterium]